MPIPTKVADLSLTAGSNSPAGADSTATNDDYLRALSSIIRSFYAVSSATIASAATADIASSDGENVAITGAVTITSLGAAYAGCLREVYCVSTPTFTHSAAIILPGASNITAVAGDIFVFRCLAANSWALVSRSSSSFANAALTGTSTVNGIEIGFRSIPTTVQNTAYSFAATDVGKSITKNDASSYTYTVPNSIFVAGNAVTVVNDSGSGAITIAQGVGVTLYLAGAGATGNRTVSTRGVATILFTSASTAYVMGPGVT
jgi:hypothetical protein